MKRIGKRTGQLVALAAFGTMGTAHAYEWQINEDTFFSIYGTIELAYVHEQRADDDGEVDGERELLDNGSGISFAGEHEFDNGLTAYFNTEFDFSLDEKDSDENGSSFTTDEAFVGLRGNFGAVQVGDWDGVYEDNVEDLLDIFEYVEPTNSEDFRTGEVGDAVAYLSPSYNGFSFAVQGFFKGEGEGQSFDDNPDDNEDGQAFQAVAKYEADLYGVYLGYDNNGLDEGGDGTFGVGGTVDLAPVTLAAKIESVGEDSEPSLLDPADPTSGVSLLDEEGYMLYGIAAIYDYGLGTITGAVNQVEPGADSLNGRTEFGVNVNYELAENFYVYLEHFRYDREDDLGNATAGGLVYAF